MTDDDTTVDELTDRINELEAQVEQQQATIAKMLPTRRSLLKGGATLGAGALVGSAVTGLASADPTWSNATGGWGTQSTPLDEIIVRNGVFQTVSAEDLSVTAETVAIPTRSTTSPSTSAASRIAAYDGDSKDNLSEFSSGTFSPTETGGYNVTAIVEFGGTSASGDTVECIVTSSGSDASLPIEKTLPRGGGKVDFSFPTKTFDSANDYTIEARNIDSNYKIDKGSRASIVREVVD